MKSNLQRSCLPLAAILALATGCIHTYQKKQEPSDEQLLELYTTTATYLYQDGSLERAQEQAVKALEIDRDHEAMRRLIAWVRLRLGTNEDLIIAERFFRDLRADGDESNATLLGLATVLERMGTAYDQASREFASGERTPPAGEAPETFSRDLALKARDYWSESELLYESTLAEGEGSTSAMNGLQRVHALRGEYEKSLEWSVQLLERSTEEVAIWRRMLTQSELTEREESFFRENELAAQRLQNDTHLFAASILNRLGRFAEAIEHLDSVEATAPELPQIYSQRAQLYGALGNYAEAIADLDRFLRYSDLPYEHEDIQRAFDLRMEYERNLAQGP